jgi:4-hydroxy-tetrahydrodipicolinate synthase
LFRPSGVIPALVTPFTDDGKQVDEKRLRALVRYVLEKGATGVVPCGTTGEFQNLTVEERKLVSKIVIEEVKGRVPVIVGTGCSSTDLTVEMTKHAKDAGADAALIVTPYYHKPALRGIYEHYRIVAETVDLPIMLYNIPQVTGVQLPWQVVEDLAEIPNIVGVKDSSGELRYILALIEKTSPKLSIMCGHDEVVLPALAAGCSGMILASANIIPDVWRELYDSFQRGELQKAREIQLKVQKFCRVIVKSGSVGPKAAMDMIGVKVGPVRLPLTQGGELTYEDREELRIDLEKLGKIPLRSVAFEITPGKPLEQRFSAIDITPENIRDFNLKVGEALVGEDSDVAHIDLMMGRKDGPLGEAFAKAKASPSPGHEPLVAILEPNLAVKPLTLIVPTVTVRGMRQASLVYGPAQAAVAKAVVDTVDEGFIPKSAVDDLLVIVNVFVHPSAVDRKRVYINNYKAMRHALRKAIENRPGIEELLQNKERAKHPFRYTP